MTETKSCATVKRPKKPVRRPRFSRAASAVDTITGFGHDVDIPFALTMGQFSLLDLIEATLAITGPAHVALSTWSTGFYDLEAAQRFVADGRMLSLRFVMDSSDKRGQAKGTDVADVIGPENIRTTRTHAKFVIITNDEWNIVITTSMNLNLNPRSEQFTMTDCAETAAFLLGIVDELFAELPEGATYDRTTPQLQGVESVQPSFAIEMTPVDRVRVGSVNVDAR